MLTDGPNTGEQDFRFKRVPGAKSYVYQATLEPLVEISVWYNQAGTASKTRFTALERGKRYWCRVMAIGSGGQTVYSTPLSRVVQQLNLVAQKAESQRRAALDRAAFYVGRLASRLTCTFAGSATSMIREIKHSTIIVHRD